MILIQNFENNLCFTYRVIMHQNRTIALKFNANFKHRFKEEIFSAFDYPILKIHPYTIQNGTMISLP